MKADQSAIDHDPGLAPIGGSVESHRDEREATVNGATICLDIHDLAGVIHHIGLDRFADELIDRLRTAIKDFDPELIHNQARSGFSYTSPNLGLIEWMPAMAAGDVVSVKTVGYHPENPASLNLPSVLATTSVYETATGRLSAICESTLLTALRTGAASAIMTDAMVHPDPITLGVVGCGAQAVTQVHSISRVRTIKRLVVSDIDREIAGSLQDRLPEGTVKTDIEILDIADFGAMAAELDVLCTCTSVEMHRGPVVELDTVKPGLHINAVGSDFPGKVEIPIEFLRTAVVVPDVVDQCLAEGESQQLTGEELGPDMVAVLTDPANRELVNQRTVFDSTGWSYEDQIAAKLFMEHAARLSLGTPVQLQHVPDDPYDPFEVLHRRATRRNRSADC